jgi:hypothetical protein
LLPFRRYTYTRIDTFDDTKYYRSVLFYIQCIYSGGDGVLGFPMEAHEVTQEELKGKFPTKDVLEKWQKCEEADWPPFEQTELPELRFAIGTKVFCRIGPDATKDWAPGEVVQLWYTEKNWPPGSFAPYKIKLDDGRQIFAPGDMDAVIRERTE